MVKSIKNIIRFLLNKFGLKIIRSEYYNKMSMYLSVYEPSHRLLSILDFSGGGSKFNISSDITKIRHLSKSQLFQDIFVLTYSNFKRNGYFVEFGATNGVDLSNTWLLEKEFGWEGILAEPAKYWHEDLSNNRSSNIEGKAVWVNSDEILTFLESTVPVFSTIADYRNIDGHSKISKKYEVKTISLENLLDKYDAPSVVDYLSIDTEGSEFDILSNFDFEKYKFKVITVEHNFTSSRQKINKLLSDKGYKQVLESISSWDDWYILPNI